MIKVRKTRAKVKGSRNNLTIELCIGIEAVAHRYGLDVMDYVLEVANTVAKAHEGEQK